ncbi:hypothetical protein PM082_011186 [Marasmius tenuissimus]|nr:hypothetical protein PM082_011186 [Marasmius tenuissimus]
MDCETWKRPCPQHTKRQPAAPISVPRRSDKEDIYQGYRIPAGSIVLPNIWAMLHDESVYPDPFSFKPERFLTPDGKLNPDVQDPGRAFFGFGKRLKESAPEDTWPKRLYGACLPFSTSRNRSTQTGL